MCIKSIGVYEWYCSNWGSEGSANDKAMKKSGLGRVGSILRAWGAPFEAQVKAVLRTRTRLTANVELWAMLNLNPHPLKAEGAAPRSRLTLGILVVGLGI
jgi:hypothetical protein